MKSVRRRKSPAGRKPLDGENMERRTIRLGKRHIRRGEEIARTRKTTFSGAIRWALENAPEAKP